MLVILVTAEKNCFQVSFKLKAIKTAGISKFVCQRVPDCRASVINVRQPCSLYLPSPFSSLPFLSSPLTLEVARLNTARGLWSALSSPSGIWAEPQQKSNLVYYISVFSAQMSDRGINSTDFPETFFTTESTAYRSRERSARTTAHYLNPLLLYILLSV